MHEEFEEWIARVLYGWQNQGLLIDIIYIESNVKSFSFSQVSDVSFAGSFTMLHFAHCEKENLVV